MAKILVIGAELPQFSDSFHIEAASYRTWQFVSPLIKASHKVFLVARRGERADMALGKAIPDLCCWSVDFSNPGWIRQVNVLRRRVDPDCIVAVTARSAMYATRIRHAKPIWMDLYGDLSAENQVSLAVRGTKVGGASAGWLEHAVLSVGDVFSSCGERQRYAIIGKLGLLKRLNGSALGYEFVYSIPPGVFVDENPRLNMLGSQKERILPGSESNNGKTLPENAVVVLWAGGYNVWTDIRTLFDGLTFAMQRDLSLHYVSAGAGVVDLSVYDRFCELVRGSPFRDRFHLLGWQPHSVVKELYLKADIGISIDAHHYEVLLGTRTRLVEMAAAGLALLSTRGCELVDSLEQRGAIRAFEIGDSAMLGAKLVELVRSREQRDELGQRARKIIVEEYSFDRIAEPLLRWVEAPAYAPDKAEKSLPLRFENRLRLGTRQILWKLFGQLR
jgi:glycosyltransferase involved in cell wall biosynthesis